MVDPRTSPDKAHALRVLVLSGSLRADSLNTRLAKLAARHAERRGAIVDLAALREFDVPLFDGDYETDGGVPPGARALERRLLACDAFVIASPEYNASMPGMLKNLIDWVSRARPQPFHERHGLLMSASPSMGGGNRGLWALRVPFEHLGARIYPDMFSLAVAHKAFTADGLVDPTLQRRFEQNVDGFLALAEAAKNYPCIKQAWVEFLGESADQPEDRVDAT